MASIEHDDIEKGTNGEAPPDAQVVVHLDLTGDRVSNAPLSEWNYVQTHRMGIHSKYARTGGI